MRIHRKLFLLLAIAVCASAQTWDTSGNGMLNGTYYFRQVIYVLGDGYGDLSETIALYGSISFDGNGGYTLTANNWVYFDSYYGPTYGPQTGLVTGTYSIASSGYGFISNPASSGDYIYGLVSQKGIFVGSSTDNANGFNDLFVTAPLASPAPTAASFSGTYVFSDLDLSANPEGYGASGNLGMTMTLAANGAGKVTTATITGYTGTSTTAYPQSFSNIPYIFSNGAAVVAFPTTGNSQIAGQKYLYFSPDGNFVFGGSPYNGYAPWDMIVGVKVSSGTPNLSGLYYQAGIDAVATDLDTYFGSFDAVSGTILDHQRIEDWNYSPPATDDTFSDTYSVGSGGAYSGTGANYVVSGDGSVRIGWGLGPYLGLNVALQAPSLTGTGVFLNPQGIVNAASNAPFTAGIAPGELLLLYGSNLSSGNAVAGIPFQTTLNNVQVTIGNYQAPIYYVYPTQMAVVVPYEVTAGTLVDIQVSNNGQLSNSVPVFVNQSAPGILTQNENGLGYADALDNTTYAEINSGNPAVPNEILQVYLTGLGAVSPAITDGYPGPATTLSEVPSGSVAAYLGGVPLDSLAYAGLAPNYSGLYQIDTTLSPLSGVTTALTAGDNVLTLVGPDSTNSQALIPFSTSAGSTAAVPESATRAAAPVTSRHALGRQKVNPKTNRGTVTRHIGGTIKQ